VFFFEKKNKKTFACCGRHRISAFGFGAAGNLQKFFASFFQKRSPFLLRQPSAAPAKLAFKPGLT
jgi:hypothetical protein